MRSCLARCRFPTAGSRWRAGGTRGSVQEGQQEGQWEGQQREPASLQQPPPSSTRGVVREVDASIAGSERETGTHAENQRGSGPAGCLHAATVGAAPCAASRRRWLTPPRLALLRSHPGYFGKVGMRYFHKTQNKFFRPVINVDKLWSLVSEQVCTCTLPLLRAQLALRRTPTACTLPPLLTADH